MEASAQPFPLVFNPDGHQSGLTFAEFKLSSGCAIAYSPANLTNKYYFIAMSTLFDQSLDRRANSRSAKWHFFDEDVLPMWVADMDFRSPQVVIDALKARVEHGVFGYEWPSKEFLLSLCNWCKKQYDWDIETEHIVELPGLVSGLNAVSRAFSHVGDAAITLTPVYPPFLSAPVNQGMTVTQVPLVRVDDEHETFHYSIDFEAFEKAITSRTKLFILCNPHNPTGHEYTRDELSKLADICVRHDVLICSDEIHCDLLLDDTSHLPIAKISPEVAARTITLMAPSKTFNLPGLGFSFAVIQDKKLRDRFNQSNSGLIPHTNALGMVAAQAAYDLGQGWLTELRSYLTENRNVVMDFVAENLTGVKVTKPNATYLSWMDVSQTNAMPEPQTFFLKQARVALNNGAMFGAGGDGFVRVNFGAPRTLILEGLERMHKALKS